MIDCVTLIESKNKEQGKEPCPRFQNLSEAGNRYWLSSFKVSKFKMTSFRKHSKYFPFSGWPLKPRHILQSQLAASRVDQI